MSALDEFVKQHDSLCAYYICNCGRDKAAAELKALRGAAREVCLKVWLKGIESFRTVEAINTLAKVLEESDVQDT